MIPQRGKISLRQLSPHGIHGSACVQVLSDRTFRVKLAASTSPSSPPSDGVQQSIVEHHIIKRISFSPTTLYVGDLTIHASGLSLPALRQLQFAMTLISYIIDHSFRSSTSKSFSIHFFLFMYSIPISTLSIWCPNPISPFRQVPRCHSSSNCSGGDDIHSVKKKLLAVSSGSCRLLLIYSRIYTTNNSSASILPWSSILLIMAAVYVLHPPLPFSLTLTQSTAEVFD